MTEYLFLGLPLLWVVAPVGAGVCLLISWLLYKAACSDNSETLKELQNIDTAIQKGIQAYLKTQYRIIISAVIIVLSSLLVCAFYLKLIPWVATISFTTGVLFQFLSEYISIKTGTTAAIKASQEARKTLTDGFKTAFRFAASISLALNGLVITGIAIWFLITTLVLQSSKLETIAIILSYGLGVSLLSFFTRVSGGIFTKSTDIAADLAGKIEANIPEDDARNPAVIVRRIGNIVGNLAGVNLDLFESFSLAIIASIILSNTNISYAITPMIIAGAGAIISALGLLIVRAKEGTTTKKIYTTIKISEFTVYTLTITASYYAVKLIMPEDIGMFWSITSGIIAGIIIGRLSSYYTSPKYRPTQKVIHSTVTGASTVIINGLTIGMISTWLPTLILIMTVLAAYIIPGGLVDTAIGLYGISLASVGMITTAGITLTWSNYAHIIDNASGITKISKLEPYVKERTQNLEELGVKVGGISRGSIISSSVLLAIALLCIYQKELPTVTTKMLVSIILGGVVIFILSALIMKSIAKTSDVMIEEIRRQFREIHGLINGTSKPNYLACIQISNKGTKQGVIIPFALVVLTPIIVGALLGASGIMGLLLGTIAIGFLLAGMMTTSGEIWNSTKKFIESGKHGGKDAPAHKAAVIANTVGDPLKDAVSPSINVFIKLLIIISLLFGEVFAKYSAVILEFIKNIRV